MNEEFEKNKETVQLSIIAAMLQVITDEFHQTEQGEQGIQISLSYARDNARFNRMCELVRKQGGSFAKALINALDYADEYNIARICMAFAKLLWPYFQAAGKDK